MINENPPHEDSLGASWTELEGLSSARLPRELRLFGKLVGLKLLERRPAFEQFLNDLHTRWPADPELQAFAKDHPDGALRVAAAEAVALLVVATAVTYFGSQRRR